MCRPSHPAGANETNSQKRDYGKTGVKLSIIGLGGIVVKGMERSRAHRAVADASIAASITSMWPPTYAMRGAARSSARALPEGRLPGVQDHQRGREEAKAEFQRSLQRLRTDHFDLYQLHALTISRKCRRAFARRRDGMLMEPQGGPISVSSASRPTLSRRQGRHEPGSTSTRFCSRSTSRPSTRATSVPRSSSRPGQRHGHPGPQSSGRQSWPRATRSARSTQLLVPAAYRPARSGTRLRFTLSQR